MAFPPQHISVKRRRDEDPVSLLYIETDDSSELHHETKRRRSEFVFKRVVKGEDLESSTSTSGKETAESSEMAPRGRTKRADGIKKTATGVPIVVPLGVNREDGQGSLRAHQGLQPAAMGTVGTGNYTDVPWGVNREDGLGTPLQYQTLEPAALRTIATGSAVPVGAGETNFNSRAALPPTFTATTLTQDVQPKGNETGFSGLAYPMSTTPTTNPAASILHTIEPKIVTTASGTYMIHTEEVPRIVATDPPTYILRTEEVPKIVATAPARLTQDVQPKRNETGFSGFANPISTTPTTNPAASILHSIEPRIVETASGTFMLHTEEVPKRVATDPPTYILRTVEVPKTVATAPARVSLSRKRNKSRSLSPPEARTVKKPRTFRLEIRNKDSSNSAFSDIEKTPNDQPLPAVFVEERSPDAMEIESAEPQRTERGREIPGGPPSINSQATTTPPSAQPQKKPPRDPKGSAQRAILVANSSFGTRAGTSKLKFQPKTNVPRPNRPLAKTGIQVGTQQMPIQPPVRVNDRFMAEKFEAMTLEALAEESNNAIISPSRAPPPTVSPRGPSVQGAPSDDFVTDSYVRVRASRSPPPSSTGVLYIAHEEEPLLHDWFLPGHANGSSDDADDDYDSNAEDAVGNDYPEEEGSEEEDEDEEHYGGVGGESDDEDEDVSAYYWDQADLLYLPQPVTRKRWMGPVGGEDGDDEDEDEEMGGTS